MRASYQKHRSPKSYLDMPLVIAHRGASGLSPENTLAAFRLAVALGADGVEMDVQLTADGRAVVIHDSHVNRTTNGKGPVASFTLERLSELDAGRWFDKKLTLRPGARRTIKRLATENGYNHIYSGESVPTLEAVIEALIPAKLERIYIELKCGGIEQRDALVNTVRAIVRRPGLEKMVTLLSFDHEAICTIKRLSPSVRTAATFPVSGRALVPAQTIIKLVEKARADEAALHYSLATRRTVTALHENEIAVSAWTANRPIVMKRLIASGVDAIMTNFPDRLRDVIAVMRSRRSAAI